MAIVLSFLIPLLFSRKIGYYKNMMWPILWGLLIITLLDYYASSLRKEKMLPYLAKHYVVLFITLVLNIFFGRMISKL
jgi:hypothetical protein